jgi:hypothetical protein
MMRKGGGVDNGGGVGRGSKDGVVVGGEEGEVGRDEGRP